MLRLLSGPRRFNVICLCMLLYVHSSFAIILMGKRELVALLSLYSWCLVIVVWLFLAVQWVCLQFVIVVLPDQTIFYLLDFFSSCIQFYVLLSPYICFISFLYHDSYVLGDDAWIS